MSNELSQLIELQEIESEFRQYAAEFLAIQDRHNKALSDRQLLETDLASAQQLHDKYKQDLMRVTNQKQYETALREIDATKKQIAAFEGEILKAMEEADKLDAEMKASAPDVERRRGEADQTLAALDAEAVDAGQQVTALNDKRKQLASQVSKPLFAAYDRLARSRRGQALSPISSEGICSVCRVKVRPKVFSDVRRGDQMILCENCGRILYYKNEAANEAGNEAAGQG